MKAYVGICVLAPAPLAQVKPDLYDGLKWRNIASFHGGRISAFSGSLTEPGGVRDIKVESPTLMWGKMASCGRMVSDLCGFLSTARKADYQSAARCHLAPQTLSGLAYTYAQISAVLP
jgi:hypothetical protein